MRITVLGAGAWGTALASRLAQHHEVILWARRDTLISELRQTYINARYLPNTPLNPTLQFHSDWNAALQFPQLIILATPIQALREVLTRLKSSEQASTPLLCLSKGFETEHWNLPHQLVSELWPELTHYGVLSGPSFAAEIAQNKPAALTLAAPRKDFLLQWQPELKDNQLRIYPSEDVMGVELSGAVKNIMAIASGLGDGLKLGQNARAALITRGLAELTRLGLAMGGQPETFMGLAGLGDLVLTCTSQTSRNHQVGVQLALGKPLTQILTHIGHVAEGVKATQGALYWAKHHQVELPITQGVAHVLAGQISPKEALAQLLERNPHPLI
ncbi:MAG: NAD(P)-dependent glycerol-3-phosphate dehydrogenase [Ferrovum sp.]|nr:NAD(P)-dependent glycerol-3-phosphate dehydrogenase [Ferrovum sp.]